MPPCQDYHDLSSVNLVAPPNAELRYLCVHGIITHKPFIHHPEEHPMQQPKPSFTTFHALLEDIKRGAIKIPQFQREFVWECARSAKLFDSILKGYPLGTSFCGKPRSASVPYVTSEESNCHRPRRTTTFFRFWTANSGSPVCLPLLKASQSKAKTFPPFAWIWTPTPRATIRSCFLPFPSCLQTTRMSLLPRYVQQASLI